MTTKRKTSILRCPSCGGSDIKLDDKTGQLKCLSCRTYIVHDSANKSGSVDILNDRIIDEGAKKIIDDKSMITMQCSACGSKLSINTEEATSARCPWCRHILSVTDKQPNGAIPDLILPFKVTRRRAAQLISDYMGKNTRLGRFEFVNQFSEDNVIGVYLPYMVVDMNVHAGMIGTGQHITRSYTVGSGDHQQTRYDADLYNVVRDFDLEIDDLTIEASKSKLVNNKLLNTNNIINAIMPFDTENAVAWDARYARGYVCEKRDVDIEDLDQKVKWQVEDVMKYNVHSSLERYDGGVRWDTMRLEQKGVKWRTAYMPVWLYSYLDTQSSTPKLHYVAVNARTEETVGSTPIDGRKVAFWVLLVPGLAVICGMLSLLEHLIGFKVSFFGGLASIFFTGSLIWVLITAIIMAVMTSKASNKKARHMHEAETRATIRNLNSADFYTDSKHGLSSRIISGRNDNVLKGSYNSTDKVINMNYKGSVNGVPTNKENNGAVIVLTILGVMFLLPVLGMLMFVMMGMLPGLLSLFFWG